MKLEISHTTKYTYVGNVFFEPHFLRLKPKTSPNSSVIAFNLDIEPKPAGFSEHVDIENNFIQYCWFEGLHHSLKFAVNTVLEVTESNPFNFLVYPSEYLQIPFKYDEQTRQLLEPSLKVSSISDAMKVFLKEILKETNNHSINFLTELTKQIHDKFSLEIREKGAPLTGQVTFQQKIGSCRDLAWMQIQMLRYLGIAARFVSGYFFIKSAKSEFELHAWVEAFLPGAGWIGFDPSHGIFAGSQHITLASSAFHENTMPVSGIIRGNSTSELVNDLMISVIS